MFLASLSNCYTRAYESINKVMRCGNCCFCHSCEFCCTVVEEVSFLLCNVKINVYSWQMHVYCCFLVCFFFFFLVLQALANTFYLFCIIYFWIPKLNWIYISAPSPLFFKWGWRLPFLRSLLYSEMKTAANSFEIISEIFLNILGCST